MCIHITISQEDLIKNQRFAVVESCDNNSKVPGDENNSSNIFGMHGDSYGKSHSVLRKFIPNPRLQTVKTSH